MNEKESSHFLFGPVPSRRLGLSLGVDLNPRKVCCEDCVFCQVAPTTELTVERKEWVPTAAVLAELDRWKAAGGRADFITLAGSGEPTLHTGFGDVLRHAGGWPDGQTALLSNGALMWMPEVRREALAADVVKVTLSAWDEESFRRLHRPAAGLSFEKLVGGERALREEFGGALWVEVMLLPGYNDAPEQVRRIADQVNRLQADAVHLNTATRPARAGEMVQAVSAERLETLAGHFAPVAEIPVFTGRTESPLVLSDDAIVEMVARHPLALDAFARSGGIPLERLEERLAPLVRQGRVALDEENGTRTIRAVPL
ncbi:MAG: radical SAM protein [Verrucomicrobiota bacterium]|jgi:wyosine [tRNA(Phe)-imidazoG37] synthetase (radical SAM superfamily)|nr:radical SAM protein [Verrucomicrobiota bacterium]